MKKITIAGSLIASCAFLVAGCSNEKKPSPVSATGNHVTAESTKNEVVVTDAPEWADMLMQDSGWIGADGIYTVALDGVETPGKAKDKETLFWFSDNVWGKISGDTIEDNWEMTHNSVGYMQSDVPGRKNIKFYKNQDKEGHSLSSFEPTTKNAKPGEYYWLGDGVFNHAMDSTIYIFAYLIKNVPDGGIYPFDDVGVSLIALPKGSRPPFANQRQMETPLFLKDGGGKGKTVFGISVLANTVGAGAPNPDGYIYVYGVRGPQRELLVARVQDKSFEDFSQWRYWDGNKWQEDMRKSAALAYRVSNEMSVSFMEDGRVIAAYQFDTNTPDIMIQVGNTPAGPFHLPKKVWSTPEIYEDVDFYTYNAKAHPHLSKPGELLISYNVNSFDFADDIKKHPHHLRPRFFTVKYR